MVALTTMAALFAVPAMAQETTQADDAKQVVVVGVRRSLKSAQQLKKDADTIVDSITANDIGAFPDKSVAEALQRVAGITVNRFAATGDTAHFSAEPSGVVVRGLQQVRSEFNGRDIFTADSSRGLSWSDVSPELMGGVDTYKNQTADLIEGGISGSINLRTRLPFDQKGRLLSASADFSYGDLAKKTSPSISGIYANRWDTSIGEFGFMANAAYSKIVTNSQGIQLGRMAAVKNASIWGTSATRYLPGSVSLRDNTYDRVRNGIAVAGQWQNHDHTMLATLQYNQSKKQEKWEEYVATAGSATNTWAKNVDYVSTSPYEAQCKTGTTCTFDSRGFLQTGTIVGAGVDGGNVWYGQVAEHAGAVPTAGTSSGTLVCYQWQSCGGNQLATTYTTGSRFSDSVNDTQDVSFNFKWDISERLKTNFDVQYVKATQTNYDITADMATYANVTWDLTGDLPTYQISAPTGVSLVPGGVANAANYRLNDLMDHVTNSDGHEFATRFDVEYSFDSPWLNSLRAGVRYADREQTVRWSNYNWSNTVNTWSNYSAANYYIDGSAFPAAKPYGVHDFSSDFFGGGATNQLSSVYFNIDFLKNRELMAQTFGSQSYKPVTTDGTMTNSWAPICYRTGEVGGYTAGKANTGNGCFRPAEISDVSEKTDAAYVMLKYGGPDAKLFNSDITVSGNIGVRYVQTTDASTGGINFSNNMVYATTPTSTSTLNGVTVTTVNTTYYISADDRKFLQADATVGTTTTKHVNWLPSANIKFKLNDQWQVRIAASRALSRPDIGYLKSYVSVGATLPTNPTCANGGFTCNGSTIVSTNMIYKGSAQNPSLKPVTADQIDLSVENYFASVGSFTFDIFAKRFNDYIQMGTYNREITHNGVTRTVQMQGPVNGDGASIRGFEVAYTRYFDFLPSPWNGLGIQTNYTHLVNNGIATQNLTNVSGDGTAGTGGGGISTAASHFNGLPLEGLSDDTYNVVGMFEKGSWSARLAYNWRSQYMVTAADCCIAFPIWQKAAGFLDGAVHYRVNDHIELAIQGSNLLNTKTILLQQVSGPTDTDPTAQRLLLPNAWFQNDRRVEASIRVKY